MTENLRTWDAIVTDLETITAEARAKADAEGDILPPDPPDPPEPEDPVTRVYAGGDLQTALDGGGVVQIMDAGATFERARFVVSKSNTELRGNSATLRSSSGPALWVPPGVNRVRVSDIVGLTSTYSSVIKLGENNPTDQGTLDQVPRHILMERCVVPTHRQRRGFEINAGDVTLLNCSAVDIWNSIIVDSQALCILNSPGPITVDGGEWSAASECIMSGGDTMKLPAGTLPTGLTFKNLHIFKPIGWKTDGIKRGVKNLLELKSGKDVVISGCLLESSWTDAQVSCCFVVTPRQGCNVLNVAIDRCTVRNVGMGISILAINDQTPRNDTPIDQVTITNSSFVIDHAVWGGKGCYAQILNNQWGAVGAFDTDNCYVSASAGYYVMYATQAGYATVDGVKTALPTNRVRATRSLMCVPFYRSVSQWFQSGSAPLTDVIKEIDISANTIGAGSPTMKTLYPSNTYITKPEFDLLPQTPPNPV